MTIQETIDEIEKNFKSSDLKYERMLSYFVNLSGLSYQTVPMKQGTHLIRVRYSDKMESFVDLADISYPKKCFVKRFSRLNRPYQNLFYAGETIKACCAEMVALWFDEFKKGDTIKVTFGEWILKNDLKLLIIPDPNNESEFNKKVVGKMHLAEIPFWNYISEKFKTTTQKDQDIYEFTSAFANALWLNTKPQDEKIQGFIYSSVQSKKNVNIALTPNVIDSEMLTPSKVLEITLKRDGVDKNNMPAYKEIGNWEMGSINFDKHQIEWIEQETDIHA